MSPASAVGFCVSGEVARGHGSTLPGARGVGGATLLVAGSPSTLGSLLGLLGRKKAGAAPVLPPPCRWPCQPGPCPALCRLLGKGPGQPQEPGPRWHRAGMRLSLLYVSPSALKTRIHDLHILCVRSSNTAIVFSPATALRAFFPPPFFFLSSDGVVSGEVLNVPRDFRLPLFFSGGSHVNMYSGRAAPATSPLHSHLLTCTMIFSKVLG